jgi:hypothetical protein
MQKEKVYACWSKFLENETDTKTLKEKCESAKISVFFSKNEKERKQILNSIKLSKKSKEKIDSHQKRLDDVIYKEKIFSFFTEKTLDFILNLHNTKGVDQVPTDYFKSSKDDILEQFERTVSFANDPNLVIKSKFFEWKIKSNVVERTNRPKFPSKRYEFKHLCSLKQNTFLTDVCQKYFDNPYKKRSDMNIVYCHMIPYVFLHDLIVKVINDNLNGFYYTLTSDTELEGLPEKLNLEQTQLENDDSLSTVLILNSIINTIIGEDEKKIALKYLKYLDKDLDDESSDESSDEKPIAMDVKEMMNQGDQLIELLHNAELNLYPGDKVTNSKISNNFDPLYILDKDRKKIEHDSSSLLYSYVEILNLFTDPIEKSDISSSYPQ